MPFYEFRSYVGTSGIIRESDQNPTTLVLDSVRSSYLFRTLINHELNLNVRLFPKGTKKNVSFRNKRF